MVCDYTSTGVRMPNIYYDTPPSEELLSVRNAVTLLYSSPIKQRVAFMSRLAVTLTSQTKWLVIQRELYRDFLFYYLGVL